MPSTAARKAAATALPSSQNLHDALASANNAATLTRFAHNTGCSTAELAGADGRIGILQVFEAMRRRGYQVTQPKRPQAQPKPGFTTWCVDVALPSGTRFTLAYHTPGSIK